MLKTARFQCVESQREPEPRIVLESRPGGGRVILDAASLCDQFAVSRLDTLLVLDEDNPYEEQLHLVLVRDDDVLDHVVIGAPYASGIFRVVESRSNSLSFRFESDAIWKLTLEPGGRRSLPCLPRGVRRRGGLLARAYLFLDHEVAA